MTIVSGALLKIIEESCESILTLTEEVEPEEFFNSRITQQEVMHQIRTIADSASNLSFDIKNKMAEIDWAGWHFLQNQLAVTGGFERDALWFSIKSLVPATIMWLRVFRKSTPEFFAMTP